MNFQPTYAAYAAANYVVQPLPQGQLVGVVNAAPAPNSAGAQDPAFINCADFVCAKLKMEGHGVHAYRMTARIIDKHPNMATLSCLIADSARFSSVVLEVQASLGLPVTLSYPSISHGIQGHATVGAQNDGPWKNNAAVQSRAYDSVAGTIQ